MQSISDLADDLHSKLRQEVSDLNLTLKRSVEFFTLFFLLGLIYSNYLYDFLEVAKHNRDVLVLDTALLRSLAKFAISVGWPFLVISLLDEEWKYKDAQRIAVATFVFCTAIWVHKYSLRACLLGSLMLFLPLFISATILHSIGTLRHRKHFL